MIGRNTKIAMFIIAVLVILFLAMFLTEEIFRDAMRACFDFYLLPRIFFGYALIGSLGKIVAEGGKKYSNGFQVALLVQDIFNLFKDPCICWCSVAILRAAFMDHYYQGKAFEHFADTDVAYISCTSIGFLAFSLVETWKNIRVFVKKYIRKNGESEPITNPL